MNGLGQGCLVPKLGNGRISRNPVLFFLFKSLLKSTKDRKLTELWLTQCLLKNFTPGMHFTKLDHFKAEDLKREKNEFSLQFSLASI